MTQVIARGDKEKNNVREYVVHIRPPLTHDSEFVTRGHVTFDLGEWTNDHRGWLRFIGYSTAPMKELLDLRLSWTWIPKPLLIGRRIKAGEYLELWVKGHILNQQVDGRLTGRDQTLDLDPWGSQVITAAGEQRGWRKRLVSPLVYIPIQFPDDCAAEYAATQPPVEPQPRKSPGFPVNHGMGCTAY